MRKNMGSTCTEGFLKSSTRFRRGMKRSRLRRIWPYVFVNADMGCGGGDFVSTFVEGMVGVKIQFRLYAALWLVYKLRDQVLFDKAYA